MAAGLLAVPQISHAQANTETDEICGVLYAEAKDIGQCYAYEAYRQHCPSHIFSVFAQSYLNQNCDDGAAQSASAAPAVEPAEMVPAPQTTTPGQTAADPLAVHQCDQLAGNPWHPELLARLPEMLGVAKLAENTAPAEQACRAAVAQAPDNARLLAQLGRVLEHQGDYDQAIEFYDKSSKMGDPMAL